MPHETTAWKCNFCHRCFSRKVDACNHEYTCKFNPARRMCFTCKHYDPKKEITQKITEDISDELAWLGFFPAEGENKEYTTTVQYCQHFKMPLHEKPYFEECEFYDDTWSEERPMPGTCFYWEPKEEKE